MPASSPPGFFRSRDGGASWQHVGALRDHPSWPGMRDRLCDSRPAIRRHIQLFVDGERGTLATPLRPGADVVFLTAVSGG